MEVGFVKACLQREVNKDRMEGLQVALLISAKNVVEASYRRFMWKVILFDLINDVRKQPVLLTILPKS